VRLPPGHQSCRQERETEEEQKAVDQAEQLQARKKGNSRGGGKQRIGCGNWIGSLVSNIEKCNNLSCSLILFVPLH
jgi:hypothetical protein